MADIIKIQGYKCPFCGYENTNEQEMIKHIKHCRMNKNYVQKCITCSCLENDWLIRKVYDSKSICCYDESLCPYFSHDNKEIEEHIKEHNEEMKNYGYNNEI